MAASGWHRRSTVSPLMRPWPSLMTTSYLRVPPTLEWQVSNGISVVCLYISIDRRMFSHEETLKHVVSCKQCTVPFVCCMKWKELASLGMIDFARMPKEKQNWQHTFYAHKCEGKLAWITICQGCWHCPFYHTASHTAYVPLWFWTSMYLHKNIRHSFSFTVNGKLIQ